MQVHVGNVQVREMDAVMHVPCMSIASRETSSPGNGYLLTGQYRGNFIQLIAYGDWRKDISGPKNRDIARGANCCRKVRERTCQLPLLA
jgi:hypothetical protein